MDQRILHNRTNIQNSEQKYAIKTKSDKSKGFWGKLFGSSSKEKERRLDSIPQSQPNGRYVVTEHPRNVNPNHQAARPIYQRPRPQPDHTHSTIPIEKITKDSQTSTETRKTDLKEDSGLSLIRNQGPPELELRESSSGVKISNVVQKPNEPEETESNEELQEEIPTSPQESSKFLEDPTTPNSCCSPASSDHTQSSPLPSPTRISINDRSQIPDYLKSLQKAVRTDIPPPWSKIQPYPRMSTEERVPLELYYERNLKPTSNIQVDFQRGNISDGNSDCSSETSSSYEDIDYGPHSVVRTPFGPQMIGQQTIPPNINVQSTLRRSRSAPNAQGYLNQPPIMSIPDVAQSIPNLNVQMPSNMAAALPIALMPLTNMQTPIPATNPAFNYVPSPMEPSQYHYAAYAYPGLPISFLPESKIDLSAVPHRPNIQSPPVTTPPNVGYVDEVIVAPYRDKSPQWGKEGKNIS